MEVINTWQKLELYTHICTCAYTYGHKVNVFKVNISPTQFHFIQISEVHHPPSQNIKGVVIEEKRARDHCPLLTMLTTYYLYFMLNCFGLIWLFCDPMDRSPPGSSVDGNSQARTPEWVTIFFSRGSSWPRIEPASPMSPALQVDSLPLSYQESSLNTWPS